MKKRTEELYKTGNYQQLKALAEKQVVDWHWAKGAVVEIEPYYHEEHNSPKPKKLKSEPQDKNYHTQYGVDREGHVVVERNFNTIGFYETFYQIEEDVITSFRFGYGQDKTIINCKSYVSSGGKIDSIYSSAIYGKSFIKYRYKGKLLISKEEEHYNRATQTTSSDEVFYEYDTYETLNGIRSGNYYRYQRKTALSFAKLKAEAEKRAIALLKEQIQTHAPKEKVFTIYLSYSSQHYFPPSISYGLASERAAWLSKQDAPAYIWNAAEYELNDEDIGSTQGDDHLFDELNQEILMKEKYQLATKSMVTIALALKECLSAFDLNITDDFVVVASDFELVDLKKNFKKINPEKFEDFKNRLP